MQKVQIFCPVCGKTGNIEVQENIVKESQRGITAVNVGSFLICKHSFIVYIDMNFVVRDSFVSDFKIELPQVNLHQEKEVDNDIYDGEIDHYLISINLSALTLTSILKSCLNGKKVIFINDLEIINENLMKFFETIFNELFTIDISILTRDAYKKEKKRHKGNIIIENNKIISDKKKFLNLKDLKIESTIIQVYLAEPDPESSIILLKNEINKAFIFSKDIIDYFKNFDASKELFKDDVSDNSLVKGIVGSLLDKERMALQIIVDQISKKYNIRIQKQYAKFLLGIIKNYFKIDIKSNIKL